jgi:hypothetical protein
MRRNLILMKYDFPYEVDLKLISEALIYVKNILKGIMVEIVIMISHGNCMYLIQVRWWICPGKDR